MHKNTIAFVLAAALGGFIGGFWLANSINRSAALPSAAAPPSNANTASTPQSDDELSDSEITAACGSPISSFLIVLFIVISAFALGARDLLLCSS